MMGDAATSINAIMYPPGRRQQSCRRSGCFCAPSEMHTPPSPCDPHRGEGVIVFDNLGKFLIIEAGCLLGFFAAAGIAVGALATLLLVKGCG